MANKKVMGFLPAAREVLAKSIKPLSSSEIVARALDLGILETEGKTPQNTLHALLMRDLRAQGNASSFEHVRGGFRLRKTQRS